VKRQSWLFLISTVLLFAVLSMLLVSLDAFDQLYRLSREHDDWELDEFVAAFFAAMFVSIVGLSVFSLRNTRQLRKEMQLRASYEEEAAATRHLQSLGTLSGGLAHSANNFLQPIMTLSRLTRDELPAGSEHRENLERILHAATGASDLFQNVLSYSHPDSKASETFEARTALEKLTPLLQLAVKKTATLRVVTDVDGQIQMNPSSFADILLALVGNANDALPENRGEIRVETFPLEGGNVGIRIRDSGKGMTEEEIERAFDPFYTSKPVGQGTGLGLSIVRNLLERHGGSISLESPPEGGTLVELKFQLPMVSSERSFNR